MKTWVLQVPMRGTITYLVKNCKGRKEALEKYYERSADVEAVNTEIDRTYDKSMKIRQDRPRKGIK